MYKVFIENEAKTFQLKSEKELLKEFKTYKFIEAAGGIVENNNAFLFIKRNGFWDIPKGKLDKNEEVEAAAVREIEEECGLNSPKIVAHLINTWHTYEYKGKKVLKKTYWYYLKATNTTDVLSPQLDEGITEVCYLSLDEFEKIKSNTFESIIEVMQVLEDKLKK